MKIKYLLAILLLIGLINCTNKYQKLNSHDKEISDLINQFIGDTEIKTIQKTSKLAYGKMNSIEYLLRENERVEFTEYKSNEILDWVKLGIKTRYKKVECFDKKNCYVILKPIFSKNGTKAIVISQINRISGGYMTFYLYKKTNGEWKQIREIGKNDWLYCS